MCRSVGGSITPITGWLQCAGHALAPLCRSSSGSYVPVGDSQRRFDLGPRHAGCQYRERVAQIDHRVQPGAEKIRGGHRKPALQIFQKVNAIALETGGFGKASGVLSPRGERDGLIVQGRLKTPLRDPACGRQLWPRKSPSDQRLYLGQGRRSRSEERVAAMRQSAVAQRT